jgi:hypothetical protein
MIAFGYRGDRFLSLVQYNGECFFLVGRVDFVNGMRSPGHLPLTLAL